MTAAPAVLLPCAVATDTTLGCAIAQVFARAGWDICVYFDVQRPGERAAAEHCCATVASLGRQAVALPTDIAGLGHSSGASALISRSAGGDEGLGRLPRCLINAPVDIDSKGLSDTPMRIADGDVAPNTDGAALLRLTEVNVAPALTLSAAFHRAWVQADAPATTTATHAKSASASGATLCPDLSVINMMDAGMTDAIDLAAEPRDTLAFILTQASMRTATPVLAKRFAPRVRVVGVSMPLVVANASAQVAVPGADTDLTEAICAAVLFLANASTTTGSILLVDGGAHVHRAARRARPAVPSGAGSRATAAETSQSVASTSDPASEIAQDPHCK